MKPKVHCFPVCLSDTPYFELIFLLVLLDVIPGDAHLSTSTLYQHLFSRGHL